MIGNGKQIQLDLFDQPTFNVQKAVKVALNDDVRASGLSREQVVERMNDLADRNGVSLVNGNAKRLTIESFEKWLNPSDLSRQIPVKAIPIFCAATGYYSAVEAMLRPTGLQVIGDQDQKLLKWAGMEIERRRITRASRQLATEVGL